VILDESLSQDYIADDLRLSQVITNLLSNAVKFTPEGGKIRLAVEGIGRNESSCTMRFSVSDTGIGMTEEQVSRLFNAFEQADGSVSRKFGGTGLGLAISKSIVEKMDGHIWVESEPGVGSTFFFDVTLTRAPSRDGAVSDAARDAMGAAGISLGAEPAKEIPDLSDVRIILAEDVEINREIFIALLEETNIVVKTAENGRIAVDIFKNDPDNYDLIIMDVQMPEMDGYQATQIIRALDTPRAKTIPVIAMTANVFKDDIEACLAAGMDDHIGKPLDIDNVLEKLRKYFAR